MINLFYEEAYWGSAQTLSGPKKVIDNLKASLDQENIPYAINEEKYKNNFLVQYDYTGHLKHSKLTLETCVIGPQIWSFDEHVNTLRENPHYYKTIVTPSQWVKDLYVNKCGFPEDKVSVWPVGITLPEYERKKEYGCLVYYKRRDQEELSKVRELLSDRHIPYNVMEYGQYSQNALEILAPESDFCFVLNGTESQGIAIQEIMSYNTPMLVWDIESWEDQGPEWSVPATSVPYWSDECGERFINIDDMEVTFDRFYSRIGEYNPRKYVEDNLSYKKSIETLLEIFDAD
tara:strand:+ start:944 stop:1810 length:867 start_codon:yes stop_codon:yes gene_type:complete